VTIKSNYQTAFWGLKRVWCACEQALSDWRDKLRIPWKQVDCLCVCSDGKVAYFGA
jgi:hypothetical protein